MFTNVLPGLREIRAPLAAGYLWLAAGWLIGYHRFPDPDTAKGLIDSVYSFFDQLGTAGAAIALSLAAYVVGGISLSVFRRLSLWSAQVLHRRLNLPSSTFSPKGFRALDLLVSERLARLDRQLRAHGLTLLDLQTQEREEQESAEQGISRSQATQLRERREALRQAGVRLEQTRSAANLQSQITRFNLSPADLGQVEMTIELLDQTGLSLEELDDARNVFGELARKGISEQDFRTAEETRTRLEMLGLNGKRIKEGDEIELRLQQVGLPLEVLQQLEDLDYREQETMLSGEEVVRSRLWKERLAQTGLTNESIRTALETRNRLQRRGLTFDVWRQVEELEHRVASLRIESSRLDQALAISEALRVKGLTLESTRQISELAARLSQSELGRRELSDAKLTLNKLSNLGLTPEQALAALQVSTERGNTAESVTTDEAIQKFSAELLRQVMGEGDLVATRLLSEQPAFYSAVDRLRSESEFRVALVPPLTALALMFAFGLHIAWGGTLIVPLLLLLDGREKSRDAGDLLSDALFLGRVQAPSLEKVELAANELIQTRG